MNIKSSRKAKLSIILIVLFTVALLTLIGLATWRNNVAASLQKTVKDLGEQNEAINLVDNSIEKFSAAENAFRLYAATGQKQYKFQYTSRLNELRDLLSLLERTISNKNPSTSSLGTLLDWKAKEANVFLNMRRVNDSLIRATSQLASFSPVISPVFKPISPGDAKIFIERTTTVEEHKSGKKLFGRIRDAVTNKGPKPVSTITTVKRVDNNSMLEPGGTTIALNELLKSSIDKLNFNYQAMSENERRLILSNDTLLTRLSLILRDLKKLQVDQLVTREEQLTRQAGASLQDLSYATQTILAVGVFLALVILINAWQLYKHDKKLVAARNEAVRQTHVRGDFLAHMSHEIRTPLNSILGFSEQLEKSSLNDMQKEQIAAIRQSSRILLSIVNDVLDLSKFETGNLNLHTTNFYPEKTIKHVISSLQVLAAKKNISLTCDCDMANEFRLSGDEYRLKQVLINLINNAVKFTDLGRVAVKARVENNNLLVEVSDTGRGIAKENLASIFEEFTQITRVTDNEKRNGTGLGLAICKKIIMAQGGKLDVKSDLGNGSVFSFEIPYAAYQPLLDTDVKQDVQPALNTSVLSSRKVLVAEDDKMNIKLISTIFNKWGLSFDIAESGNMAFEYFAKNSYDMILTDIHMPGGDGIWLTKAIRDYPDKTKSGIPILAITANAMQKDLDEYKSIGIDDHVVKPFNEGKLFERINHNLTSLVLD